MNEPPATDLSPSTVHSLLADDRRRVLIQVLGDWGTSEELLSVKRVAEVAAHILDEDVDSVYGEIRNRHLPNLAVQDVVNWYGSEDVLEIGPNLDVLVWYITDVDAPVFQGGEP